jgi:diguanylate cyclase (GGDEF)-like protein
MQQIVKGPESVITYLVRLVHDGLRTIMFMFGNNTRLEGLLNMQAEMGRCRYDNLILAEKLKEQEEEIAHLKAINAELETAALFDPLTGLSNRRGGHSELERVFASYRRQGHGVNPAMLPWHDITVVVVDLDNFKSINDEHGHEAGDKVLRLVADVLKHAFRADDITVRWGGDEFVVYAIGAEQDAVLPRAATLANNLTNYRLPDIDQKRVVCSIGIAHGKFQTERGGHELINRLREAADTAMYEAKKSASIKNCIATAPDDAFAPLDVMHP